MIDKKIFPLGSLLLTALIGLNLGIENAIAYPAPLVIADKIKDTNNNFKINSVESAIVDIETKRAFPLEMLLDDLDTAFELQHRDLNLLIAIEILQPTIDEGIEPILLNVNLNAEGYDSPATGYIPDWEENYQQYVSLDNSNEAFYIFQTSYQWCYQEVNLTISLGDSEVVEDITLPCAE